MALVYTSSLHVLASHKTMRPVKSSACNGPQMKGRASVMS